MLKQRLWFTCQNISHREAQENRAHTIYRKLVKRMRQAALYGESDLEVGTINCDDDESIMDHLNILLAKEGLYIDNGRISWKPSPSEEVIPKLTGRELIQAGYNPADGDLFARILRGLKEAIIRGEVKNDIIQGQIVWVNKHFPK